MSPDKWRQSGSFASRSSATGNRACQSPTSTAAVFKTPLGYESRSHKGLNNKVCVRIVPPCNVEDHGAHQIIMAGKVLPGNARFKMRAAFRPRRDRVRYKIASGPVAQLQYREFQVLPN